MKVVLSIAGFDPSGGAGVVADLKTFKELKCHGLSVITSLTNQNTHQFYNIKNYDDTNFIFNQINKLHEEFDIQSTKIGMLGNKKNIESILKAIKKFQLKKIVLDPILESSNGQTLLPKHCIPIVKKELIPLCTVVTVNKKEAEVLSGIHYSSLDSIKEMAKKIIELGTQWVLIKGGHFPYKKALDMLVNSKQEIFFFKSKRLPYTNVHGTGCVLSSALTAFLSQGYSIYSSMQMSKKYISRKIKTSYLFPQSKQRLMI